MTEADAEEPARQEGLPLPKVTLALLGLIWLLFAGEMLVPAGFPRGFNDPSLQTLVGWGGMSGSLVLEQGEWFRIFTAALLHGSFIHILMNSIGLYAAGRILEPFVGRIWFLGLFVAGAIGGGIASVHINPANVVAVGASGAIMGLFGFFLTISLRFPKGEVRKAFITNSLSALLPSLLPALFPLVTGSSGLSIDYAAHGGGALAGALVGLAFARFWGPDAYHPPWQMLAVALIALALAVLAYGATVLAANFGERSFIGRLMPESDSRRLDAAASLADAEKLIADYPDDPRGWFSKVRLLVRAGRSAEAEAPARAAVERAERYPRVFTAPFRVHVRISLVGILLEQRKTEEAKAVAKPICGEQEPAGPLRALRISGICPAQ